MQEHRGVVLEQWWASAGSTQSECCCLCPGSTPWALLCSAALFPALSVEAAVIPVAVLWGWERSSWQQGDARGVQLCAGSRLCPELQGAPSSALCSPWIPKPT